MNSQTILISICLVILIFIASIITISFTIGDMKNVFEQSSKLDSELYKRISTGTNYVYQTDTSKFMYKTLLNGLNFSQNQFLLMYDSTPFASKGHVAMTLPCNKDNPSQSMFQVLEGRAPDLFPVPLGYIKDISSVPTMCVYHGQYVFGDPVTDLALKYVGEGNVSLNGPYSIIVSKLESYIPKQKSFEELQHAQMANQ
jgi:hypothetical protein